MIENNPKKKKRPSSMKPTKSKRTPDANKAQRIKKKGQNAFFFNRPEIAGSPLAGDGKEGTRAKGQVGIGVVVASSMAMAGDEGREEDPRRHENWSES